MVFFLHPLSKPKQMNATNKKIIAGLSVIAIAGIILYLRRRQRLSALDELKSEQVAEHGYETAHDILFPHKGRRFRRYRSNYSS
jgi:hypothetical protein